MEAGTIKWYAIYFCDVQILGSMYTWELVTTNFLLELQIDINNCTRVDA
jgi:hypothetical protein